MARIHYAILYVVLAATFVGEFYLLSNSQDLFPAGALVPTVAADGGVTTLRCAGLPGETSERTPPP